MSYKKNFHLFTAYHFFSNRVRISWNNGDNRKVFVKLNLYLGSYHVVLKMPKTSPEKLTKTVVEMQQLPDTLKRLLSKKKFFA